MKSQTLHRHPIAGFAAILILASFLVRPNSLPALGIALPDQDAFATARGNAFAATANDPSAVFYNPAGITQLDGTHFSFNAYAIEYNSSYHNGLLHYDSQTEFAALPQVFSSMSLPYGFTFGLGTYSPYGLRMVWPNSSPLATVGEEGEIDFLTLNPILAYKILPTLSVAAGPTLSYSEADLKIDPAPGLVDHVRGRDTSAGFDAGVLWHPLPEHSFGVTYRSGNDMNYNGHGTVPVYPFNVNASATANFHFPQTVVAGYSFRPTPNWNFEADANWSDWTTLRTVTIQPFGENLPFDWHPSWMFDFGATRYLGKGWRLSSGFMYSMNSVPDNTFNPVVPDSDRYIFSLGVGKTYKKFSWDFAYQLLWGPPRGVPASGDTSYPAAAGSYDFFGNALSINFGYRF